MKLTEKILGFFAGIGAVLSAIFYVLFMQKKAEENAINQKYEEMKKESDAVQKASDIKDKARKDTISEIKENEQKLHDAKNGNTLDNFNAINDILSE